MNQRKVGVILSYISMGINALIGLVYIPLLLTFLTKEQYGLYQLVGSMIAYIAVMDFGLSNTTVRYYSRYLVQKDKQNQENLLAIMLRLYGGISGAIIIVGIILLYALLPFYTHTLSPGDIITAKKIYWILLFNLAIVIPGNIFVAIIQSHEKFIFLRVVSLCNIILQPILVLAVLYFKADIVLLAIIQTLCNLGLFIANVYYSIVKLKVRFHLHKWERKFVKEIMFFSFFVFLNAIMDQVYWKTSQLVLGAVAGTIAVAVYSVVIQLCMVFMSFSSNISTVFLPKLSALAIQDDMKETNAIFLTIGRLQFYVVMLLFWGFVFFGKQFLHLWVGDSFMPAYLYTVILMAALIVPLVQNTGILILQAKNKHAFRAVVFFIIAILNVCLSIPLAKAYGALACACVTGGCLILGQGLILNIYYAKMGIHIFSFFRQIGKIFVTMLLPVGVFWCLSARVPVYLSAFVLVSRIILFITLYCLTVWIFSMNKYEKNLILVPLKRVFKK